MDKKKTEVKNPVVKMPGVKGILKGEVDGKPIEWAAFYLEALHPGDEESVSAAFGDLDKDYISLKNGEFPLVSYNRDNASIPWQDGGELTLNRDPVSGRYSGSFTADFKSAIPAGIPKRVSGIFEVWNEA